jgi:CBS domain-containing protein
VKVSEIMTAQVVTAPPTASIQKVASIMAEVETGAVPITEDGKVTGLITDRDIVVRLVATGGDLNAAASTIMSGDVQTCSEDDTVADAAGKMASHGIRRLVVTRSSGGLAGILSLGDIAVDYGDKAVGHTLEEISSAPAGQ